MFEFPPRGEFPPGWEPLLYNNIPYKATRRYKSWNNINIALVNRYKHYIPP